MLEIYLGMLDDVFGHVTGTCGIISGYIGQMPGIYQVFVGDMLGYE